jgi:glycosyltransferase involved in cell wall biosynthesis
MLAYNHEQFIGEALASVLAQQTDFLYTIIVGEDCSTDGTRAIVESYRQRYPDRIKPIYQTHNLGPGANLKACLAACQAPYIAALDGDDYWTDPRKLAKQVAWLDGNPDFTICFHHVEIFREGEPGLRLQPPRTTQTEYTLPELLWEMVPPTAAVVLRNCLPTLPSWLFETYPIDVPLFILYAEMGKAKLLPEVMGRYRHHPGGTWTGVSNERNRQRLLAMYRLLMRHFAATPHNRPLKQTISRQHLSMVDECIKQGYPASAFTILRESVQLWPYYTPRHAKSFVGVSLRWLRSYLRPARIEPREVG